MASFLKVLFRNLLEGPSTDPFPFRETFTPERLRGKCEVDPELCMGCGVCKNSCAAGAIDISKKEDGFTITIWRDSCCLCASCRHYCPTGAMSITNDWHHAHEEKDKFQCIERQTIKYEPCAHCGAMIRPLPLAIAQKLYASNTEVAPDVIRHLCPKCRQLEDARRIERVAEKKQELAPATNGQNIDLNAHANQKAAVTENRGAEAVGSEKEATAAAAKETVDA